MNDNASNCEIIYLICCAIIGLYKLLLAITEAVCIGIYNAYNHECDRIWNWIIAASIIDFISIILFSGYMITIFGDVDSNIKILWKCLQVLHIPQIVIAIWAAHIHFKIDGQCYNFWNDYAPELLTVAEFHHAELWIGVISVLISCCCGALYVIVKGVIKLLGEGRS